MRTLARTTMTRRRKLLLGVLTSVLASALVLAAIELGCGIALESVNGRPEFPAHLAPDVRRHDRGVETVADPWLLYRVKPGIEVAHQATNRFGIRGGEIPQRPEPGTIRILLLGGSVAWGYEAQTADETIPALLEALLRSDPGDSETLRFEVLNAAAPGWVAWQEALAYATRLRRLAPHLIVTLDGVNDVHAALTTRHAGWPMNYAAAKALFVPSRPSLAAALTAWFGGLVADSKVARLWKATHPPRLPDLDAPAAVEVAAAQRAAMELLADLAAVDGADVLAALQPTLTLPGSKPRTDYEQAYADWYEGQLEGQEAYYADCYAAIRAELSALDAARPEFSFVDASLAFAGDSGLLYYDHCHLALAGRRLVAAKIAERIRAELPRLLARAEPR